MRAPCERAPGSAFLASDRSTELKLVDETPPIQTEVLVGTETVLVVEDEPSLCRLVSVSLEKRGYTVLAAEDGAEAIRILENNPGAIDLVVSDIMMPQLNGLELREKSNPGAARYCDFCSSLATRKTQSAAQRSFRKTLGYLEKPFLPIELARKVRTLLNERDTRRGSTGKTA